MTKTHYKQKVTLERLRELLSYDPDTGRFVWLVNRRCVRAGDVAGTVNSRGYIAIMIDGMLYTAHRLAFLWMHGVFPDRELDHINRDRADNRHANLRLATSSQNKVNTGVRRDNSSGFRGVSYCKVRKKYLAQIAHNGKKQNLGRYLTLDEAVNAYESASKRLHGDFKMKAAT